MRKIGSRETEAQRRHRIRSTNFEIWYEANKQEIEEAFERKRLEEASEVDVVAWQRMSTSFPETFQELKEFEKEFPNCNGSFVWAIRAKIYRDKHGIWI